MDPFAFPALDEFLNRRRDLDRLENWWSDGRDRNALAVFGRRRVGKSWLVRRFAHGKPAVVLVADTRTTTAQLARFSADLTPVTGVAPAIADLGDLFRVLYRLGAERDLLVIIDEFPYLLPTRAADQRDELSSIQAAMEERDASRTKIVLCGSHLSQMRGLLGESSPLRGRLTATPVRALRFEEAQEFVRAQAPAVERIERYAVAGGMSLNLSRLAPGPGTLRTAVCAQVLDSGAPLFNDPREVLEEELTRPGVYFSIIEELARGSRGVADIAAAIGRPTNELAVYLRTLRDMEVMEQIRPINAGPGFRGVRYRVGDDFMRFWFRFVFPHQEELRSGMDPRRLFDIEIGPELADHTAPVFERLCREWVLHSAGVDVTMVGPWWGRALDASRAAGERTTEEIDIVGTARKRVTLVGECKWTASPMDAGVLRALEEHKLPALMQDGLRTTARPTILLFARSGFSPRLTREAEGRDDVRLIDADELVAGLGGSAEA